VIDTHAHLDACADAPDELVRRAREAGVGRILTVGTTIERSRKLSARAISTWRAIKSAVCSVVSVVSRSAIHQMPTPRIPKMTTTVAQKTVTCC